jgi:hypothetical protein
MHTLSDDLTSRYERIITGLLSAISAHKLVLPRWLLPVYEKLYWRTHARVLQVFFRLRTGTYRKPRKRPASSPAAPPPATSTPATSTPATPALAAPDPPVGAAKPPARKPAGPPLPRAWKWLARALPSPMWEAARTCADDLQHWLAEPEACALLAAAPSLRTHLRPLCHAIGVLLPGEDPPPDAGAGPEPPPPPPEPWPLPEIGEVVRDRDGRVVPPRRISPAPAILPGDIYQQIITFL